jgi:hypothetical protein
MIKVFFMMCLAFLVITVGLVSAQDEPFPQYVSFVAYENDSGSDGTSVYWLDVQSGEIATPRGLAEDGFYCPLNWSPDGQWWVYAQQDEGRNWSERLLNVATGETFSFYGGIPYHSYFVWSPDSSQLVFTSIDGSGLDLRQPFQTYVVHTDSEEVEVIASGIGRTQLIQWLSETQFLQITVDENNQIHFYWVETSTQQIEEEIFTPELERPTAIGFSPDGTLLVFTAGISHRESYFLNIQTGDVSAIWDTEDRKGVPVWSPDGRWFAYRSFNEDRPIDEQARFVFEDTEGGETISVSPTTNGGYPYAIYGSPDSNHAVLETIYRDDTNGDSLNLDIVDLETGEVQSITSDLSILSGDIIWISNTRLLFTSAPASLPPYPANDIYSYDLNTQEILNLTNSEANEMFECGYG